MRVPLDDENQHLTLMMTEMVTKMQVLLDKQDELGVNIAKIKEAVYDPDKGLYARLSKLDSRLDNLEAWKNNNARIIWIMVTTLAALLVSTGWQAIF